jgi:hypothetical protein
MILDPEAIGDGTGIGIDVCREGSEATDQIVRAGMAVLVGEILAQPAPQCLDRHQVRTVTWQWHERYYGATATKRRNLSVISVGWWYTATD